MLLPGLMSAGIGSVIYRHGPLDRLSSSAYALTPFSLPAFSTLTVADFGWAIALAFTAALATIVIIEGARMSAHIVAQRAWLLLRRQRWPSAAWRSRSPRSLTSQRVWCSSPARTPSPP